MAMEDSSGLAVVFNGTMILKNILFEAAVWWNEPPAFLLAGLFSYLCFIFYKKWQEKYQ